MIIRLTSLLNEALLQAVDIKNAGVIDSVLQHSQNPAILRGNTSEKNSIILLCRVAGAVHDVLGYVHPFMGMPQDVSSVHGDGPWQFIRS